MNIYQKLAVATAGAALSLAMMETYPAHAAIITYDLAVDVTSGPLAGTRGSGFLTYDTSIPRGPSTIFTLDPLTEFRLSFLNRTFTQSDILVFDRISKISFFEANEQQLGNIRFVIRDRSVPNSLIVIENNSFNYTTPSNAIPGSLSSSQGSVTYTPVPEPLTILGAGMALGFATLMEKQYSTKGKKTK